MTVHQPGHNAIALYIGPEELRNWTGGAGELDERRAKTLALSAMRKLGLPVRGSLEIEAYAGRAGLMLFAQPAARRTRRRTRRL
jgi:hypothetical protein